LDAAVEAGVLDAGDRRVLADAWRRASAIRNATVLVTGRPSDAIRKEAETLTPVSRLLGYGPGQSAKFLDDYRRDARHARSVFERVFYED
jgi:glutamate-ammonia-ligase adenylyltransferase